MIAGKPATQDQANNPLVYVSIPSAGFSTIDVLLGLNDLEIAIIYTHIQ